MYLLFVHSSEYGLMIILIIVDPIEKNGHLNILRFHLINNFINILTYFI